LIVDKSTILASVIAIVLAASSLILYSRVSILQSMYEARSLEYENLRSNYESMQSKYDSLLSDYHKLNSSYTMLSSLYEALFSDYQRLLHDYQSIFLDNQRLIEAIEVLNISYRILYSEYNATVDALLHLYENYEKLNNTYNDLFDNYKSMLRDYEILLEGYRILDESYKTLEARLSTGRLELFIKDYLKLTGEVNIHALHPKIEDLLLITPNDLRVKSLMLQITGGWSGYLDLDEIAVDIKAMFDWVIGNVRYRSDGLYPLLPSDPSLPLIYVSDMWQYPNQTLAFREGDCDDQAILLASMLSAYFRGKLRVECIVVTDHMAVYIPFKDGKIMILDPALGYYTGSPGTPSFSDIRVEIYRWIGRLEDLFGRKVNVKWVFSDSILKLFYSTESFIEWLYETV